MATFNFEKFSKAYAILNAQKKDCEEKMKALKAQLEGHVNQTKDRKVETKFTTMYFKAASTKDVCDCKKLKAEDPELYAALVTKGYITITPVKEAFTVNCKAVLIEADK